MLSSLIRGGQLLTHSLAMLKDVVKKLFLWSLYVALLLTFNKFYITLSISDVRDTYHYMKAKQSVDRKQPFEVMEVVSNRIDKNGQFAKIKVKATDVVNNKRHKDIYNRTTTNIKTNLSLLITYYLFAFFAILTSFLIKGYFVSQNKYLRGAKIVPPRILNRVIKRYNRYQKTNQLVRYNIANITYPSGTEQIHTIITGASGTGKTVLLNQLVEQIRRNGDRAIIYDRMGAFVSKFYNGNEIDNKLNLTENDNNITPTRKQELKEQFMIERDTILNPLDVRTPYWSLFNEVRNKYDFDSIAAALIPEASGNMDPFWNNSARVLFSSVANKLKEIGKFTNKDLTDNLLNIGLERAAQLVKDTPAQLIIDPENPKTALSVMTMIATNLRSLTTLREEQLTGEHSFSIRDWINNDKQKGFLFISSRADMHETLKPLISTWLDIAINSLLSLEQSQNRKIWIIIDELASLHFLPSLHTGLAESRQFGGCFVLSLQTFSQLNSVYGYDKARITSGLCRNRVVLNTPDKDTAQWCSDNLGKQEIKERRENVSFGVSDAKDSVSINQQEVQKNIILPTEIMQLPNLQTYIKFAGDFPVTLSKFKYKNYAKKAERYEERKEIKQRGINEQGINQDINQDINQGINKQSEVKETEIGTEAGTETEIGTEIEIKIETVPQKREEQIAPINSVKTAPMQNNNQNEKEEDREYGEELEDGDEEQEEEEQNGEEELEDGEVEWQGNDGEYDEEYDKEEEWDKKEEWDKEEQNDTTIENTEREQEEQNEPPKKEKKQSKKPKKTDEGDKISIDDLFK
ncbi:MAG: type IV secretion system DNA-binding domain-containing protein [Rickettsiales bacterium]|jgi:hypothetical protein|nr:type IV secretion system DNA-binding domain-containing protein [Rickettsiales bacterium]